MACDPVCSTICNVVDCSVCHSVAGTSNYPHITSTIYFQTTIFSTIKSIIATFRSSFSNTSASAPANRTVNTIISAANDWNSLATYANTTVPYKECVSNEHVCSCDWNWLCTQCSSWCNANIQSREAVGTKTVPTTTSSSLTSGTSINTHIIDKLNQRFICGNFQTTCSTYNCVDYCPDYIYEPVCPKVDQ